MGLEEDQETPVMHFKVMVTGVRIALIAKLGTCGEHLLWKRKHYALVQIFMEDIKSSFKTLMEHGRKSWKQHPQWPEMNVNSMLA